MESTRASSKGQMVIPKPIRDALDIRSGTELSVELVGSEGFKVTVKRADRIQALHRVAGILAHRAQPMTAEAEDAELLKQLTGDDDRIRRAFRRR